MVRARMCALGAHGLVTTGVSAVSKFHAVKTYPRVRDVYTNFAVHVPNLYFIWEGGFVKCVITLHHATSSMSHLN